MAVLLVSVLVGCGPSDGDAAHGKQIFAGCAACHGPRGQGIQALGAPNIAGLPRRYVEGQLQAFLGGRRGTAAADTTGRSMAAAVDSLLESPDDVASVAGYVSGLPAHRPPPVVQGGDPVQGKVEYRACALCHGAAGKGRQDVPPVVVQADWYLLAQLHKYRASLRGAHEGDPQASRMRAVSIPLSDKQIRDVVAYIETLR